MKRKLFAMLLVVVMLVSSMPMALADDNQEIIQPRSDASVRASMTTSGYVAGTGSSAYEQKIVTVNVYRQSNNAWVWIDGDTKTATAITVTASTNITLVSNSYYKVVATCKTNSMSKPISDTRYYNT